MCFSTRTARYKSCSGLLARLEHRPEDRVPLKLTDSIPVHHNEIEIASKTRKQEEGEPGYFPSGEPLRYRRKTVAKQMNSKITDVACDDGKPMNSSNYDRTAVSDVFPMNTHSRTYHLTEVNEPLQLTKFIEKVSLSSPVLNPVCPAWGIDLISQQKVIG